MKQNQEKRDKVTKYLERAGIIVGIIISIASFVYTCSKDNSDNKENIALICTQYGTNDKELFEEVPFSEINISGTVSINYGVVIANNSKMRISIVEANIEQLTDKGIMSFNGIFDGIYSSEFKKLRMPLVLDSGESKSFVIRVKSGIPNKVFEIIKEKYKFPIEMKFTKMKDELAEKGMDIFGNSVIINKLGDAKWITIPEPKYPSYLLTLKTANGSIFQYNISINNYNK